MVVLIGTGMFLSFLFMIPIIKTASFVSGKDNAPIFVHYGRDDDHTKFSHVQ